MWTLGGNDVVIMVYRFNGLEAVGVVFESTVREVQSSLGASAKVEKLAAFEAGGREIEGRRVRATIAGTRLEQNFYALGTTARGAWLLAVQDSGDDAGGASAEREQVDRLLRSSLKLGDS